MEIREIGRWDSNSNTEVFYDSNLKACLIRENSLIQVKPLFIGPDFTLKLEKNLEEFYNQKFLFLRINPSRCMISVLTENFSFV